MVLNVHLSQLAVKLILLNMHHKNVSFRAFLVYLHHQIMDEHGQILILFPIVIVVLITYLFEIAFGLFSSCYFRRIYVHINFLKSMRLFEYQMVQNIFEYLVQHSNITNHLFGKHTFYNTIEIVISI